MQLTKLRAAPDRQDKVPPCAPAGRMDGSTASQLIRSVRWTLVEHAARGGLSGHGRRVAYRPPKVVRVGRYVSTACPKLQLPGPGEQARDVALPHSGGGGI